VKAGGFEREHADHAGDEGGQGRVTMLPDAARRGWKKKLAKEDFYEGEPGRRGPMGVILQYALEEKKRRNRGDARALGLGIPLACSSRRDPRSGLREESMCMRIPATGAEARRSGRVGAKADDRRTRCGIALPRICLENRA